MLFQKVLAYPIYYDKSHTINYKEKLNFARSDNGQATKKEYWEAKIQHRGEVTFLGLFREKDSERGRHWKKEVIRREIKREG